jgi:hypothetical protein
MFSLSFLIVFLKDENLIREGKNRNELNFLENFEFLLIQVLISNLKFNEEKLNNSVLKRC